MDIARPKAGFILVEPADFQNVLKDAEQKWPRVFSHWEDIKERLKITAHREGAGVAKAGFRVFEAEGEAEVGLPTIRVAYVVLGDTVTFKRLGIFEPNGQIL